MKPGTEGRQAMIRQAATLAVTCTKARSVGLFTWGRGRPRLEFGDGLDQHALDYMAALWTNPPMELTQGVAHYVPNRRAGRAALVVPCMFGGRPHGLLYLEARPVDAPGTGQLGALAGILGAALQSPRILPVGPAPRREPSGTDINLRSMLEANEWNISRVARILGLTRMTIYNRLRRAGIPREKVRRTGRSVGARGRRGARRLRRRYFVKLRPAPALPAPPPEREPIESAN